MANKIICRYCAAEFDEMLPKCPYCDSTNYKGAEAEYFEKLEDVRDNMEDLEDVPEEEAKKEIRKQGNFLKKVFIVIGVIVVLLVALMIWLDSRYERDEKAGFLWVQANVPVMNDLYEQGKYDEAMAIYIEGYQNPDVSLYDWEHDDFFQAYDNILYVQDILEEEANGHELSKVECTGLFYDEWKVIGLVNSGMDEEEWGILSEYTNAILKDFHERWNISEEDYEKLYNELEENSFVSYSSCEKYIDKWYEEK